MIATRPNKAFWHCASEFGAKPTGPTLEPAPGEIPMTNGNGAPPEAAPSPQLNVLAQYTKDLSFENPHAPASLAPQAQQPAISIQINVTANNVAEHDFEGTLSGEGKAETAGKVMFS